MIFKDLISLDFPDDATPGTGAEPIRGQIRRGTTDQCTKYLPLVGEIIYDTEKKLLYVGDGVTTGGTTIGTSVALTAALATLSPLLFSLIDAHANLETRFQILVAQSVQQLNLSPASSLQNDAALGNSLID